MDEKFRRELEENGADVETTLKRFMNNEKLYMKFILKFLDDDNFFGVKENIEKQDYKAVFEFAHSLKGVSANLGLEPIHDKVSRLTEELRNKRPEEVDVAKINELGAELEKDYYCFCRIIEAHKNA